MTDDYDGSEPPSIPIRAGGLVKLQDLRDLVEVLDLESEDAVIWVSEHALTFHGSLT